MRWSLGMLEDKFKPSLHDLSLIGKLHIGSKITTTSDKCYQQYDGN